MKKTFFLIIISCLFISTGVLAQTFKECTKCTGTNASGEYASAIGTSTQATGMAAFASGKQSVARGHFSTSLGLMNVAQGYNSTAIGRQSFALASGSLVIGAFNRSLATSAFVIGAGASPTVTLDNNIYNSLMIGFNSNLPTLFVSESRGAGKTGKIGIGNITEPEAKLHIKADAGEEASMLIEPAVWSPSAEASLYLGTKGYGITADANEGLKFHTQSDYLFNDGRIYINWITILDERSPPQSGWVLTAANPQGDAYWAPGGSLWKENGTDIYFKTGNVGIGTINTFGYALAVAGKILTDEVMVKHIVDWHDYVLKDGYKLRSLNELELFISENNHLPDIPSESQVKEKGIALGEMDGLLLKKIEELTLYAIQQQKMIELQQQQLEELKKLLVK